VFLIREGRKWDAIGIRLGQPTFIVARMTVRTRSIPLSLGRRLALMFCLLAMVGPLAPVVPAAASEVFPSAVSQQRSAQQGLSPMVPDQVAPGSENPTMAIPPRALQPIARPSLIPATELATTTIGDDSGQDELVLRVMPRCLARMWLRGRVRGVGGMVGCTLSTGIRIRSRFRLVWLRAVILMGMRCQRILRIRIRGCFRRTIS